MTDSNVPPADANIAWHRGAVMMQAAKALEKNNFAVIIADSGADAKQKILNVIGENESVAFGGSATVQQLGIIDALQHRGQKLFLQKSGVPRDAAVDFRRQSIGADVYMASPNAVTLEGTLLFVDKIGNRAAGMMFGPKKVIAVAGINKIVPDEQAGHSRVDCMAGPVNAKRLELTTPCTVTGRCADCESPQRICNISVVLWKKPAYTEYYVVLVPEELGY